MLSFRHEILVELFRGDGELAVELLRTCAGIAVDHARVALGSIDLSQVAPTEYRADAVVILHGARDRGLVRNRRGGGAPADRRRLGRGRDRAARAGDRGRGLPPRAADVRLPDCRAALVGVLARLGPLEISV